MAHAMIRRDSQFRRHVRRACHRNNTSGKQKLDLASTIVCATAREPNACFKLLAMNHQWTHNRQ